MSWVLTDTGAQVLRGAAFGPGSGSILEEVYCFSSTVKLTDCYLLNDYGYCSHYEDAGVRCGMHVDAHNMDTLS